MPCEKEQCCCKCKLQLKASGHPWNAGTLKSECNEVIAYACMVFGDEGWVCLFDKEHEHGLCESFTPRGE